VWALGSDHFKIVAPDQDHVVGYAEARERARALAQQRE
jgi:hypothetical protein